MSTRGGGGGDVPDTQRRPETRTVATLSACNKRIIPKPYPCPHRGSICSLCLAHRRVPFFFVAVNADGIGKAMATQMAKKGMNILLISRTESKLVNVEAELQAACPKISVEHLAIDYSSFDEVLQVRNSSR